MIPPQRRFGSRLRALAVGALFASVARSAEPPPATPSSPAATERIVVQLVEVDLWADDRDGRPVNDLRRDELVLKEDRHAVPIERFEARAHPHDARPEASSGSPAPADSSAAPAESTVAIFFDDAHLDPGRRDRVAREVAAWLDRELSRESWALVALHDRGTAIAVPRTRDHDKVRAALESLTVNRVTSVEREREEQRVLQTIRERQRLAIESHSTRDETDPPCSRELMGYADSFADEVEHDARATLRALSAFSAALGTLPGRKIVLYVSEGIPSRPGAAAYDLVRTLCDGSGLSHRIQWAIDVTAGQGSAVQLDAPTLALAGETRNLAGAFDEVVGRANAQGVTIWTLGAAGVRAAGQSVQVDSRDQTMPSESRRRAELDDALTAIASGTGGEAILNRNDFGVALDALSDDLDSGYTLAYTSPRAGDGRAHTIEVETTRPGVRLRHRRSWRDAPLEEDLVALVESASLFGLARPGLGVELSFVVLPEGSAAPGKRVLRVSLPASKLTLLPAADGHLRGQLVLAMSIRDPSGSWSTVRWRQWLIDRASGVDDGAGRRFVRDIELPAGAGESPAVIVGVRDDLSGQTALERLDPSN